ncbi:SURF1 family protein [Diaphorobacter aerolatus]|nr:SURF1 family protein [Diaphorobacter aerolatus]
MVGIALFFGFLALGTWQVQRRAWKLDLMERVEQRLHATPVAAPTKADEPISAEEYEYQPVVLEGRWLADKTVLSQALTGLGAGFWVMTPLERADGSQVLVNRGFVPEKSRASIEPVAANAPVRVQGLLRMSEPGGGFLRSNDAANDKWHSRDVSAIGAAMGLARVAPYFVDQGIPDIRVNVNADAPMPAVQGPWPRGGMTVVKFHNSHAVYIFTWYGLAFMVLIAAWLVVRHERRKDEQEVPGPASDA